MFRALALLTAAAVTAGCGYVGEPLPPTLDIPQRITDLSVIQRGARIVARFTAPKLTTEGLAIRKPGRLELRVGPAGRPFQLASWEANAQPRGEYLETDGAARIEFPAAEWIGKEVVAAVRVFGVKGREAGWSNWIAISVVPPLEPPAALRAEGLAQGVRLSWQSAAPRFHIFRRTGSAGEAARLGDSDQPQYFDTTALYGASYRYSVQAAQGGSNVRAESEPSAEIEILFEDRFPPGVPSGLAAVTGAGSIELAWERNAEPDLAGYRVYRAEGDASFEMRAGTQGEPSYSDRQIRAGRRYRYAVTAVDQRGNESARSAPVEAVAP